MVEIKVSIANMQVLWETLAKQIEFAGVGQPPKLLENRKDERTGNQIQVDQRMRNQVQEMEPRRSGEGVLIP